MENIKALRDLPVQYDRKHKEKHEPVLEQYRMLTQDSLVPVWPVGRTPGQAEHFDIMTSVCKRRCQPIHKDFNTADLSTFFRQGRMKEAYFQKSSICLKISTGLN